MINYDQLVCQALPTVLETSRQLQEASAWIGSDESDVKSSTWPLSDHLLQGSSRNKEVPFPGSHSRKSFVKMHERAEIGGPFSNLPNLEALSYFSGPRVEALLALVDDVVAIAWGNMRGRHLAQLKRFQPFDHLFSFCCVCRSLQVDMESPKS